MPSRKQFSQLARQQANRYEQIIKVHDAGVLAFHVSKWNTVQTAFEKLVEELLSKESLIGLSPNQIFRLAQYQRFVEQLKIILNSYEQESLNQALVSKTFFSNLAVNNAGDLFSSIGVSMDRLPVDSINRAIAYSDGKLLQDVFEKRFNERSDSAFDVLLTGISKGDNPLTISKEFINDFGILRYEANRITRTEVSRVYNDVSIMQYQQSGLVKGYELVIETDACDECKALENKIFDLEDDTGKPPIHSHCRCCCIPVLN